MMESPRTHGLDCENIPRRLGDTDAMGYIVGFIEEDGTCWESCEERDRSVTGGRFEEAFEAWNRAACVGPKPDPAEFAHRYCRDLRNLAAAREECEQRINLNDPVTRFHFQMMRERIAALAANN